MSTRILSRVPPWTYFNNELIPGLKLAILLKFLQKLVLRFIQMFLLKLLQELLLLLFLQQFLLWFLEKFFLEFLQKFCYDLIESSYWGLSNNSSWTFFSSGNASRILPRILQEFFWDSYMYFFPGIPVGVLSSISAEVLFRTSILNSSKNSC